MTKQIEIGSEVRYAYLFTLFGETTVQRGIGIVRGWDIVGTDHACIVEVTNSPCHKIGEIATIRQRHCTAV